MAHSISLTHQIGTLCGSPISDSISAANTFDQPTTPPTSVSALWQPAPELRGIRTHHRKAMSADLDFAISSPPVSRTPCAATRSGATSPLPPLYNHNASVRPDMAMVCRALAGSSEAVAVDTASSAVDQQNPGTSRRKGHSSTKKANGGVPVFVMLPLDTVKPHGGGLNRKKAMHASLMALKSAGVEGIMVDVWWGVVEREGPGMYDWSGYSELFEMARKLGLKVQAVMSFHQCGGNVGDSCTIPLPRWVTEEIDHDPDLAYTDQWGRRNYEYVSLGCDTMPVLKGRTPVQCYADYMRAFRDRFRDLLSSTIIEIQVGMGPAGELRYPSYPEQDGVWRFPGIGAFQCYGKYMLEHLKSAAEAAGKPEWGHTGPTDAGGYNNWPEDTPFFRHDGGWKSEYGEFFLSWYAGMLLDHGDRILSATNSIFHDDSSTDQKPVKVSVKVAGIHWHYGTRSHAAELTAGYYNTRYRDGYVPIARLLAKHGAVLNFTCVEMRDYEQPQDAQCRPEGLVRQVAMAAREAGVELAGENALPRYDEQAYDQIVRGAVFGVDNKGQQLEPMCAFTYLRMFPELFHPNNWRKFVGFVKQMGAGRGGDAGKCLEQVERESAPLISEAAAAMVHN